MLSIERLTGLLVGNLCAYYGRLWIRCPRCSPERFKLPDRIRDAGDRSQCVAERASQPLAPIPQHSGSMLQRPLCIAKSFNCFKFSRHGLLLVFSRVRVPRASLVAGEYLNFRWKKKKRTGVKMNCQDR